MSGNRACTCHRHADSFRRPTVVASADGATLFLLASGQALVGANVSIEGDGSCHVRLPPGWFDRIEWVDLLDRRRRAEDGA